MANKKFFSVVLVILLAFGFVLSGCKSISKDNQGSFNTISVPAKDFTSLGLVFTESVVENNKGEVFTYYALLKKAKELGADTIVNVTIDKQTEGTSLFWILPLKAKVTWYGAATAIKYVTGTIKEVTTNNTDGTTVTKEGVIMSKGKSNDSAPFASGFSKLFKK